MTKHLFLTSQVQFVANDLGRKIDEKTKQNCVFVITSLRDKPHSNLEWHYKNKSSMEKAGFNFVEYDLTNKDSYQVKNDLKRFSSIYIEGGNSFYLLQESQKSGFISYIRERVSQGMTYIGTSAGTVIASPDIEPVRQESRAALAPNLKGTEAYKLTDFVVMPHWGQEERKALYNDYRLNHIYNEKYPYIFLSDNQYVEVTDDTFQIINVSE